MFKEPGMLISRSSCVLAVVASLLAMGSAGAEDLAGQVAASLRDSGTLAGYRVNVKAKDGTVWLTGTVSEASQIAAAVGAAENTPGVERVVNRISVARDGSAAEAKPSLLSLPDSIRSMAGMPVERGTAADRPAAADTAAAGPEGLIQLVQATTPVADKQSAPVKKKTGTASTRPTTRAKPGTPRPLASPTARPMPMRSSMAAGQRPAPGRAMRTSAVGEPMTLPTPAEYGAADLGVVDGQMVPGSVHITEGGAIEGPVVGGPGMGGPMPMGGTGVGMPPVPVRGNGPNMPNYAWPSYAAYPNYAALQYPTQYSPTAWPYIGPFYPYPQVPLGWRRVSLEWDDGWWFLDFDDRHHHSHHR